MIHESMYSKYYCILPYDNITILQYDIILKSNLPLFNRDLNHGCLVHIFSLRFSGSRFLIILRRQFRARKIFFVYVKFFVHKVLRDLLFFNFVFEILYYFKNALTYIVDCSFIKTCSLTGC